MANITGRTFYKTFRSKTAANNWAAKIETSIRVGNTIMNIKDIYESNAEQKFFSADGRYNKGGLRAFTAAQAA